MPPEPAIPHGGAQQPLFERITRDLPGGLRLPIPADMPGVAPAETSRGPRGLQKGIVTDLGRLYRLRRTEFLAYNADLEGVRGLRRVARHPTSG